MGLKGKGLKKSGITASTPENLLLGAGTFYKDLKYDKEKAAWDGTILSATSGGGKFLYEGEFVNIEIDGATVKVKGLTQKVGEKAELEANVVEVTPSILKMTIVGKDAESDIEGFDLIISKPLIEDADYLDNIAFVGYLATNEPIIIILENALCTSGLELSGKNKENASIPVKFECYANFDEETQHDVLPVKIYYPNNEEATVATTSAAKAGLPVKEQGEVK